MESAGPGIATPRRWRSVRQGGRTRGSQTPARTRCGLESWAEESRGTLGPHRMPRQCRRPRTASASSCWCSGHISPRKEWCLKGRPRWRRRRSGPGAGHGPVRKHHGIRRVGRRAERNAVDRHDAVWPDTRVGRAKEDLHRLAMDVVIAGIICQGWPVRGRVRHRLQSVAEKVALLEMGQQMEEARAEGAAGRRVIADDGRQMSLRIVIIVRGNELLDVVGAFDASRGSPPGPRPSPSCPPRGRPNTCPQGGTPR